MKRIQHGLVVILMVGLMGFTANNEGDFEGTFSYLIKVDKSEQERTMRFKFFVKGEQTLIRMKSQQMPQDMKMMIDKAQSNFFMLMNRNDQKIAMKQSLDRMRSMRKKASKMEENSFEKTGKTKTIKGYKCNLYKIKGSKVKGNAWVTDELALNMKNVFNLMQQNPSAGSKSSSMFPDNYPDNGITMKSKMKYQDKDGEVSMKIQSVEEKSVSKDRFDISDYRVMDMSGMPKKDK